jgi:hypothetical protein
VQFGSPFATLYLLELLGETGRVHEMLDVIRDKWGGMMDDQTTTFWESFPEGSLGGQKYPTRSYCHAWSSGAAYVFSRYVLGVRFEDAGGKTLAVTPRVDVLESASGVVPLIEGQLEISWSTGENGEKTVILEHHGKSRVKFEPPNGWTLASGVSTPIAIAPNQRQELILKQRPPE